MACTSIHTKKQYKKAYKYAKECASTYENYLKSHKDKIHIYEKLTDVYFLLSKINALENKDDAYWINKAKMQQEKHLDFDITYNFNLSDYYFDKGNYKKAEELLIEIYPRIDVYPPEMNSPKNRITSIYGTIQFRLGKIYQKQKEYLKADRVFLNSYYINQSLYGNYNADTLCSLYYLIDNMRHIKSKDIDGVYEYHINELLEFSSKYTALEKITQNNYKKVMEQFCI